MSRLSPSLLAALAASALVLSAGASASRTPAYSDRTAGPGRTDVVTYRNAGRLRKPVLATIVGRHDPFSGCAFRFPRLTRAFGEAPVVARQISTDFANCTTVIERGHVRRVGSGQKSSMRSAPPVIPPDGGCGVTGISHFRLTWYDIAGITVNWQQSNLYYCKSSTCVTTASGDYNQYWLTASGWGARAVYQALNPIGCAFRKYATTTQFVNSVFCWPGTVTVYDTGVSAGVTPFALSGWADETHENNAFACPSLHYGVSLF